MGESDRSHRNERRQSKRRSFLLGANGNAVVSLFSINAVFFLILMMIRVGVLAGDHDLAYLQEHVMQWFELPSAFVKLTERPWTLITYMFSDSGEGLIRFITNMVWLWGFGKLLQQMAGNDKLIPVYIYGGLAGALFFILSHYAIVPLFPARGISSMIGANAAVMAVAMAATTLQPNFRFFVQLRGGIPIWVLMAIYLLIDFLSLKDFSAAYSIAHIGGALAGFLFVIFLRQGYDGSAWMHKFYNYVIHVFEPKPALNTDKDKIFYDAGHRRPYEKSSNVTQKRVDEILDKINQKGYHFLTEEEKAFLKKASEDENL